jgi:hypothetical protein
MSGDAEENLRRPQSGWLLSGPRFEEDTYQKHSEVLLFESDFSIIDTEIYTLY